MFFVKYNLLRTRNKLLSILFQVGDRVKSKAHHHIILRRYLEITILSVILSRGRDNAVHPILEIG